MSKKGRHST